MPIEKVPFLQNTSGSVIDNRHEAYRLPSNPSPAATMTSSTAACVLGSRQKPRQIGCEPSGKVTPPPCKHPVNHSSALEFYRDAVAPDAPLC